LLALQVALVHCRNLRAMALNRTVVPLLFAATALAAAAGCNNQSTVASTVATATPVPTVSGATPLPTTAPATPTPTASPVPQSYQPLANNDAWSYTCTGGGTLTKTVSGSGVIVGGVQTFADTLTASDLPTSIIAMETTDGVGNTLLYQWNVGASTTVLSSPALEYGISGSVSGPYQGPVIGTITETYLGSQGTITVPGVATPYSVVEFKFVNSQPIFTTLGEIDAYVSLGAGPIRLVFPDDATLGTCTLSAAPTLH
jgi:hypothetical protein